MREDEFFLKRKILRVFQDFMYLPVRSGPEDFWVKLCDPCPLNLHVCLKTSLSGGTHVEVQPSLNTREDGVQDRVQPQSTSYENTLAPSLALIRGPHPKRPLTDAAHE